MGTGGVAPVTTGYERAVRQIWSALYRSTDGEPPPGLRNPAGFELERSRRLGALATAAGSVLPVATFVFLASEGSDGLARLLTSEAWRRRPAEPGEAYPPPRSSAAALGEYLRDEWLPGRPRWLRECVEGELDLVHRPPVPATERPGQVRFVPGAAVRVSGLDLADYAERTGRRRQQMPWRLVLDTVRPIRRPTALFRSAPGAGRARTLVVRDHLAAQLAWVTHSPAAERDGVVPEPPSGDLLDRLRSAGVLLPPEAPQWPTSR